VRADAATLRLAVFPRTGLLADVLLVLGGAALVALSAQIEIPLSFTPVPITGQTFAVLLVGASLGTVRGVASLGVYLAAGLVGAPVFAGGEGGAEWISGATGGYLAGMLVAAGVTGWLAERDWDRRFSSALAALLTGNVIIFALGLVWLARVAGIGLQETLVDGLYPFVVGEIVKVYLAGALLPTAWRLVERASPTRRPPWQARRDSRRRDARDGR
jgi:biotin transport system substrate-specific component